ncbi:hypothetical protein GAP32_462A [Cronobacter phage vB_CsaM_GAP32]|uniref:Uncharacterized protein n=1 Tax=Cronobacter phage vB_CsaM_GAP32 TaxID=1141136 RepID=K4F9Q5_9CAUD|nr:hypothetical protein GAP32_462A [Cronobacter phage vB_CsaM_GAP32]AFC21920.1 hypothetical protein GAP32_462A [Cronobacter phage vB_CsaM_GAP32]
MSKLSKFLNSSKCSKCGCTGIHACMGDINQPGLDNRNLGIYNTLEEAIDHVRRSEAKTRRKRKK